MPKRLFLCLAFSFSCALSVQAQRIAYIESELILQELDSYKKARATLAQQIANWEKDIDTKEEEIEDLQRDLAKQQMLLTPKLVEERLEAIRQKEVELREFQNSRFGYEGMLQIQERQLMQPVREELAALVERVSKMERVDFMFDRSQGLFMLYAADARNYTDKVIEYLRQRKQQP